MALILWWTVSRSKIASQNYTTSFSLLWLCIIVFFKNKISLKGDFLRDKMLLKWFCLDANIYILVDPWEFDHCYNFLIVLDTCLYRDLAKTLPRTVAMIILTDSLDLPNAVLLNNRVVRLLCTIFELIYWFHFFKIPLSLSQSLNKVKLLIHSSEKW